MQSAVAEVERKGAQQLILDLTDNRGGLVSEAIEIARLFLPTGSTVVSTRSVSATNVTRIKENSPVTARPSMLDAHMLLLDQLRCQCGVCGVGLPGCGFAARDVMCHMNGSVPGYRARPRIKPSQCARLKRILEAR
jgi:hypothetical protein